MRLDTLNLLDSQTWRERLLELVGLVGVVDAEGVEVPGAAHLELDGVLGPLDPHRPRVLPPCRQQEVLDLVDLLRHCGSPGGRRCDANPKMRIEI